MVGNCDSIALATQGTLENQGLVATQVYDHYLSIFFQHKKKSFNPFFYL